MWYHETMKKNIPSKIKVIQRQSSLSVADKAKMISTATRMTLEQYSKTFTDLAHYDRTEKVHN